MADQFADAIRRQWEAEAGIRRLNEPYPLSTRWEPPDPSWGDDWDLLVMLASTGVGWPPVSPGTWATGPHALAGSGSQLVDALVRVPTGRLVILGEPGAGKTMLMVRLVLDLLAGRAAGGPVPVLVPLASWNPAMQDLHDWLAGQIIADYPALALPAPQDAGQGTRLEALIAANLIVPILDGLDEIPGAVRGSAISRINEDLHPGERLVLTCRTSAYDAVIHHSDGAPIALRAAAVIEVRPLDTKTDVVAVSRYLRDDAGTPARAERWGPVIAALGSSTPVGKALTTPLMVGLARSIYNSHPGEDSGALRDPAELCWPGLADRADVEQYLFDAFLPASFRTGTRHDASYRGSALEAEARLVFLALHLERTVCSPDLAWWELHLAVTPAVPGLATGLSVSLALGLATGLGAGPIVGLATGLASALSAGLAVWYAATRWRRPKLSLKPRWQFSLASLLPALAIGSSSMLAIGLAFGLSSGLSSGFLAGVEAGAGPGLAGLGGGLALTLAATRWQRPEPSRGLRWRFSLTSFLAGIGAGIAVGLAVELQDGHDYGLISGLSVGLALWLSTGLEGVPPKLTEAASPQATLRRDRRAAITVALLVGCGVGFGVGAAFPFGYGLIIGFAYGFAYGLIVSVLRTAWPSYLLAKCWLALRGHLPWSLMKFLTEAHRRGVLMQVGTVYQFRHAGLQHRLATRPGNIGDPWQFRASSHHPHFQATNTSLTADQNHLL